MTSSRSFLASCQQSMCHLNSEDWLRWIFNTFVSRPCSLELLFVISWCCVPNSVNVYLLVSCLWVVPPVWFSLNKKSLLFVSPKNSIFIPKVFMSSVFDSSCIPEIRPVLPYSHISGDSVRFYDCLFNIQMSAPYSKIVYNNTYRFSFIKCHYLFICQ